MSPREGIRPRAGLWAALDPFRRTEPAASPEVSRANPEVVWHTLVFANEATALRLQLAAPLCPGGDIDFRLGCDAINAPRPRGTGVPAWLERGGHHWYVRTRSGEQLRLSGAPLAVGETFAGDLALVEMAPLAAPQP